MTTQTPDAVREAVARETLAKQYDATLPSRAAHIRAGTSDHKAIDAMLSFAALDSRAGDAGPAGEVEAFRRGAEAMQRKLADALRDHLNSRAAAIANGVTIPEYQA